MCDSVRLLFFFFFDLTVTGGRLAVARPARRTQHTARPRGASSIATDNPLVLRCFRGTVLLLQPAAMRGFGRKLDLTSSLRSGSDFSPWTRRAGDVLTHGRARADVDGSRQEHGPAAQQTLQRARVRGLNPARRTPVPLTYLTVAGSFTPVCTCRWRTRRSWPGLRRDGASTWTLGPRGRTRRRARPKRRSPWSGRSMRVAIPWRRRGMWHHLPRNSARQRRPRLKTPEDGPVNE